MKEYVLVLRSFLEKKINKTDQQGKGQAVDNDDDETDADYELPNVSRLSFSKKIDFILDVALALGQLKAYNRLGHIKLDNGEFDESTSVKQLILHALEPASDLRGLPQFIKLLHKAKIDPQTIPNLNVKAKLENLYNKPFIDFPSREPTPPPTPASSTPPATAQTQSAEIEADADESLVNLVDQQQEEEPVERDQPKQQDQLWEPVDNQSIADESGSAPNDLNWDATSENDNQSGSNERNDDDDVDDDLGNVDNDDDDGSNDKRDGNDGDDSDRNDTSYSENDDNDDNDSQFAVRPTYGLRKRKTGKPLWHRYLVKRKRLGKKPRQIAHQDESDIV